MEISTHKEVTHTIELTQDEMRTLLLTMNDVDREVYNKLPSPTEHTQKFDALHRAIANAVSEGNR